MKDYIHRIMRYKTITRISKEWYNMRLISKSEYRKVCQLLVIRQYDFVVLTIIYYKISAPLHNSIFLEVP